MRRALLSAVLLLGASPGHADDHSGPGRLTLQRYPWGTVYFEKADAGPCKWEPITGGLRFTSAQSTVTIDGSSISGWTLRCGKDSMTFQDRNGDLTIQTSTGVWSFKRRMGGLTVQTPTGDSVSFDRDTNSFTVEGRRGRVRGESSFGNLKLTGPGGMATFTHDNGVHAFAGVNPSRFPYLGRGFSLPFHGVGVYVDITHFFPMPEITEWVEWKPVFD